MRHLGLQQFWQVDCQDGARRSSGGSRCGQKRIYPVAELEGRSADWPLLGTLGQRLTGRNEGAKQSACAWLQCLLENDSTQPTKSDLLMCGIRTVEPLTRRSNLMINSESAGAFQSTFASNAARGAIARSIAERRASSLTRGTTSSPIKFSIRRITAGSNVANPSGAGAPIPAGPMGA